MRLDFDPPDDALDHIGWDEFFDKFDDADPAFLYQDKAAGGQQGRFHKFVSRDSVDGDDAESGEDEEG